jgi:hypothetical protein
VTGIGGALALVVLARTPLRYHVGSQRGARDFPVALDAGCVSDASTFLEHLPALERMLGAIDFDPAE